MPGISFHKTVTKNTFSEAPIPNFSDVFPNFSEILWTYLLKPKHQYNISRTYSTSSMFIKNLLFSKDPS